MAIETIMHIMYKRNHPSSAKEPFDLQSSFLSFRQTQRQDLWITSELLFRASPHQPPKTLVVLSSLQVFGIKCTKDSLMTPRTKLLKIMFRGSEGFHFREEGEEEQQQEQKTNV